MLLVAPVVAVVPWRASPFPHPGHALMHLVVLVDVVVVAARTVPAGCAVAPVTRPVVKVVVDDLPVVVADQVPVVQRVQVPAVPALVAECTRPNPRHPGHTECH